MCGLAGIVAAEGARPDRDAVGRMARALRHRGPDGYGFLFEGRVGLAHVRLSIIDPAGGAQPLSNEDGSVWLVCNGEIYNFVELRGELEARGHRFRTRSDTEVVVHAWEEWGPDALHRLNGEFAFALRDRRDDSVVLARDRFGIRPLFHAERGGVLIFASEVKGILAAGLVEAEPSLEGIDEVCTFWAARPPRTTFRDVWSLEPGCWARWRNGRLTRRRWYTLAFPPQGVDDSSALGDQMERLDALMRSAVDLRLRSDVPVGGYLSGGLDSSITAALAQSRTGTLNTFSVTFRDPALDESAFQLRMAEALGTDHRTLRVETEDVARVFPQVVRHAETPVVRASPAPLFRLSEATRQAGIKVVLTGEGADEVFLGYDLFKETLVRRFCLRDPDSESRPLLFGRLYPYLDARGRRGAFWPRFFLSAGSPDDPLFSHMPRFLLTSRTKEFYTPGMRDAVPEDGALERAREDLPPDFERWSALDRAAWLEFDTLLGAYLLSSQGDRMSMAHGVEGRVPFLDHRLFEFAASLPARSKLTGLRDKVLLRRWARGLLPPEVAARPKQPYRAPDAPAFFGPAEPEYVDELLSAPSLEEAGIFDARAVRGLVRRCRAGRIRGFRTNQALVTILSTQLWHRDFVRNGAAWRRLEPLPLEGADVAVHDPAPSSPILLGGPAW